MLQREQLESMKVEEIRKVFKEIGISYYRNSKRMNKTEMITRYLAEKEYVESLDSDITNKSVLEEDLEKYLEETRRKDNKKKYINNAKVGNIVAFRLESGKVISAAITKKSTKNQKFLVETKYGMEYKISFDDVLWVRTNKRWPKGIYLLFKKNRKYNPEVKDEK